MLDETANQEPANSAVSKGLSRRQMVKAGVWAAPVVVLATASPAAAVSVSGTTLTATNVLNNGGQATADWNVSFVVNGTTSPKTWTLAVVQTGVAGITWTTPLPTTVSVAGTITARLTVTGKNAETASFFVRLTSGTSTVDSNSVTVTKH